VAAAERAGIAFRLHEYEHDPAHESYGVEAAEALGLPPECVFKTLVAKLSDGKLAVGIVPVSTKLDLKALAKAFGAKKAAMAEVAEAERATGYVSGGISPLGQKQRLAMAMDESALGFETIHVSAGRRGLEIELAPAELVAVTSAVTAAIGR
jgi:Cys-tRNA(Pro)/Cys-tRNA(Cys) deacylase